MYVEEKGTLDYWEWLGCIVGISTLAQIMGLLDFWINDFMVLAVLNIVGILLVVLSGKRGFKSKYYDFVEMFGFAFLMSVLVLYGMFGDAIGFLMDIQIRYVILLVCSIVFFAMAKRD